MSVLVRLGAIAALGLGLLGPITLRSESIAAATPAGSSPAPLACEDASGMFECCPRAGGGDSARIPLRRARTQASAPRNPAACTWRQVKPAIAGFPNHFGRPFFIPGTILRRERINDCKLTDPACPFSSAALEPRRISGAADPRCADSRPQRSKASERLSLDARNRAVSLRLRGMTDTRSGDTLMR